MGFKQKRTFGLERLLALAGIYRKMTFDLFGFLIDAQRMLEAEGNLSRTTLQRWLPCGFLPFSARKN